MAPIFTLRKKTAALVEEVFTTAGGASLFLLLWEIDSINQEKVFGNGAEDCTVQK